MTTSLLLIAIFVCIIIGYLIVSLITSNLPDQPRFFWIKIALGVGVGYGISSILSFMWQVVIGSFNILYPIIELFIATILYWGLLKIKVLQAGLLSFTLPQTRQKSNWIVFMQFSLGCGVLLGIITFILGTIAAPNGMWDAWMVQNRSARFFYLGGDYWTNAFSPLLISADYPPLVGMSVARLWRYSGHETILGPAFFAFTITFALIVFLIASMAYFRGRIFAYLAGLTFLTSSALFVFAPAQLADIPIAFYFLSTIVLLRIYENNPLSHRPLLYLAGITSALALWTKNEGWLFGIAVFMSYFIVTPALKRKSIQIAPIIQFILGLLPLLLVVLFFKSAFTPANDFLRRQPVNLSFIDYLLNPSRYVIVIRSYLIQLYDLTPDRSTPLVVLFFIFIIFGVDRKNLANIGFISSLFVLITMIAGEFFIYLLTPNDLQWQVTSSIHRLFLQLWPIFVFEIMMLINVPKLMKSD